MMRYLLYPFVVVYLLPPWVVVAAACPQSSAVVTALLPLRGGPGCSALQLRGIQQLAALRTAVSDVNTDMAAQDGLTLGLLVQDTCSSAEGALKAAMRSLVDIQQPCSNPPLYLGMIGPERVEEITKVLGVTRVFNATHVLPGYLQLATQALEESVFFVSIEHARKQAQNVVALIRQLQWQRYVLAFEEGMSGMAEALVRDNPTICVRGSPHRLTPQASIPDIFSGDQDGVVVLVETSQMAARVLQAYQSLSTPLILLVRNVGLESWQVPRSATNLYLLQQVSLTAEGVSEAMNITLKEEYEQQQQTEFQDVHCKSIVNAADCAVETSAEDSVLEDMDVSVTPLAHGIRLIAAALRTVHRTRCLSGEVPTMGLCPQLLAMPPAEWRTAVSRATVLSGNQRLRLLTELASKYHVYTRDPATSQLVKVAVLSAGALQEVTSGYSFPALQHETTAVCRDTPIMPPSPPPTLTTTNSFEDTFDNFGLTLRELYSSEYSMYEMIGMIIGACFIMFAVMVVVIYAIYNSLVEKTDKESTGGSLETVRTSRPKERKQRRSLRDTFRRNSSTRESNRS